jgi:hypothetical protein
MRKSQIVFLVAGATLIVGAIPAHAAIVAYADLASWSAAAGSFNTVTVPDPGPSGSQTEPIGGFNFGGMNFTNPVGNNNLFIVGPSFGANPPVLSDQAVNQGDTLSILITLPSFVTAFALDYGTFGGSNVAFTLSNADSVTLGSVPGGYGTPSFFGVTDTTPFETILLESTETGFGGMHVNNLRGAGIGQPAAVPEPLSLLLISAGLGLIAVKRMAAKRV